MRMYFLHVGSGKEQHRRYFIETETEKPVAYFDDLDTAATVLRYIKGVKIDQRERQIAHRAMKAFDHRKDGEVE